MRAIKSRVGEGVVFFLSLFVYIAIGYCTERENYPQFILLYAVAFALYGFWYKSASARENNTVTISAALVLRFAMLFYLPNLSDDFYRFVWDGRLSMQGINPFSYLPSELINSSVAQVDPEIYKKLNSQHYYSVYPPLNQLVFYLSAQASPSNLLGHVILMKLFILFCELGTIIVSRKLLLQSGMNENLILLYALNPLIIIELTGNLHFEAAMIFFTALSVYLITRKQFFVAAIALGIAICTKLLPLLFIPFFFRSLFYSKGRSFLNSAVCFIIWVAAVLLVCIFCFIPFSTPALFQKIGSSINLYFQHFEFNASVFYIVRWLGFQCKGYDIIQSAGPFLSLMVIICIAGYLFFAQRFSLFSGLLFALTAYLLFATTIHPWYITPLILFSVFTSLRFPLVWSALIPFSYIAYSTIPTHENLWYIAAEYIITAGFAVYELRKLYRKRFSSAISG